MHGEKLILDGYGQKLIAIRGLPSYYARHPDSYHKISIVTNKGEWVISSCSNCEMMSFERARTQSMEETTIE